MEIPTLEQFQKALEGLMYGKKPHEGARQVISVTLYTEKQVDAVVELIGGWENLANAVADRLLHFSITADSEHDFVVKYVEENFKRCKENVRVAIFSTVKPEKGNS